MITNNYVNPNFVIVGAPKCGTTALAKYLEDLSNIYFSPIKEPHYFSNDLPGLTAVDNLDAYLNLFHRRKSHQLTGEASVYYLYSQVAIRKLYEHNNNVKIIVMLREPSQMVYSFYRQKVFSGDENANSIEEAWNLSFERENLKSIPKNCREHKTLLYHKIADYNTQVVRLLQIIPKDQILFINFHDFVKNTQFCMTRVCSFLEIEYQHKENYKKVNFRKRVKSQFLQNILTKRPTGKTYQFLQKLKQKHRLPCIPIWKNIYQYICQLNTTKDEEVNYDQHIQHTVKSFYKDSWSKVQDIIV
jgi:hypothetical protein